MDGRYCFPDLCSLALGWVGLESAIAEVGPHSTSKCRPEVVESPPRLRWLHLFLAQLYVGSTIVDAIYKTNLRIEPDTSPSPYIRRFQQNMERRKLQTRGLSYIYVAVHTYSRARQSLNLSNFKAVSVTGNHITAVSGLWSTLYLITSRNKKW